MNKLAFHKKESGLTGVDCFTPFATVMQREGCHCDAGSNLHRMNGLAFQKKGVGYNRRELLQSVSNSYAKGRLSLRRRKQSTPDEQAVLP
ncbi:MAG: hypothetical protein ACYC3P_10855, partial [Bellilinea sp.]